MKLKLTPEVEAIINERDDPRNLPIPVGDLSSYPGSSDNCDCGPKAELPPAIIKAMLDLPRHQREALYWRYWRRTEDGAQLTTRQISILMHSTPGSVRKSLCLAHLALRRAANTACAKIGIWQKVTLSK